MRLHLLVLLLCQLSLVHTAVFSGYVQAKTKSVFLGKFCYTAGNGFFHLSANSWTPNLEVFSSSDSFEKAQLQPCANRGQLAIFDFLATGSANISLPVENNLKGAKPIWYSNRFRCFLILSPAPILLISAGLLIMYLVFTCVYICIFAAQCWGMHRLYRVRALHPIAVILSSVMVVEFISVFLFLEHYAAFSSNGIGHPVVKLFAELFDMAAVTTLILLFLLIAKGWGVSDNPLMHHRILLGLLCLIAAGYAVLYGWQENSISPASTTFYYDSWPGWVIVGSRFLVLGYLSWSVRYTWLEENHPNKRKFYMLFGVTAGLWLVVLPVMVGLAYFVPSWARTRVVQSVLTTVNTAAILILTFLLWPSRAAHYFKVAPPELYPESDSGPATKEVSSSNMYEEL